MNAATDIYGCLVVGGGITGLTAAQTLKAGGLSPLVLEADTHPGGRIATERVADALFDTGAQFITVRDPVFSEMVERWQRNGIAAEWCRGFADERGEWYMDGHPRYRGIYGMAHISSSLAAGVEVRTSARVVMLVRENNMWAAVLANDDSVRAHNVLIALPVPEMLKLDVDNAFGMPADLHRRLEGLAYASCITLLVLLADSGRVPPPGGLDIHGEPVHWIADNHLKGISTRRGALTIHAGPAFSRKHWDDGNDTVNAMMLEAVKPFISSDVVRTEVRYWRYAHPLENIKRRCLSSAEQRIALAGDVFGDSRVEGAVLSGKAAAEAVLRFSP